MPLYLSRDRLNASDQAAAAVRTADLTGDIEQQYAEATAPAPPVYTLPTLGSLGVAGAASPVMNAIASMPIIGQRRQQQAEPVVSPTWALPSLDSLGVSKPKPATSTPAAAGQQGGGETVLDAPTPAEPGNGAAPVTNYPRQGAPDGGVEQWDGLVQEASREYAVPPAVIKGIMDIESGGRTHDANGKPLRSAAGAIGLMQTMPFHYQPGEDADDPRTNIRRGVKILADNYRRWGTWDQAAAAYFGAIDDQGRITDATDATGTAGSKYVQLFRGAASKYGPIEGGQATAQTPAPQAAAAPSSAAAVPSSPPPAAQAPTPPAAAGGGPGEMVTVEIPNSNGQTMQVQRRMIGEGPGKYAPSKGWRIVGESAPVAMKTSDIGGADVGGLTNLKTSQIGVPMPEDASIEESGAASANQPQTLPPPLRNIVPYDEQTGRTGYAEMQRAPLQAFSGVSDPVSTGDEPYVDPDQGPREATPGSVGSSALPQTQSAEPAPVLQSDESGPREATPGSVGAQPLPQSGLSALPADEELAPRAAEDTRPYYGPAEPATPALGAAQNAGATIEADQDLAPRPGILQAGADTYGQALGEVGQKHDEIAAATAARRAQAPEPTSEVDRGIRDAVWAATDALGATNRAMDIVNTVLMTTPQAGADVINAALERAGIGRSDIGVTVLGQRVGIADIVDLGPFTNIGIGRASGMAVPAGAVQYGTGVVAGGIERGASAAINAGREALGSAGSAIRRGAEAVGDAWEQGRETARRAEALDTGGRAYGTLGISPAENEMRGLTRTNIVPPDVARSLGGPVRIPDDPMFVDAIVNDAGGTITDEGIRVNALRHQKPPQAGAEARRGGVFYEAKPPGAETGEYAQMPGDPDSVVGGTQRIEGPTLIRRPLVTRNEQTPLGILAPELDQRRIAESAVEIYRAHEVGQDGTAAMADLLRRNGGNPDDAAEILQHHQWGETPKAVLENIAANRARAEGYDSIVAISDQYNDGKPWVSEIMDLREATYPSPNGGYSLRPEFQPQGVAANATPGISPSAGRGVLDAVNRDIGSSLGGSVFGAAAGAAMPADSDEERRANALRGAGIGLVGGPLARRAMGRAQGALATPGITPNGPQRGARPTVEVIQSQIDTAYSVAQRAREMGNTAQAERAMEAVRSLESDLVDAVNARKALEPAIESDIGRRVERMPYEPDVRTDPYTTERVAPAADLSGPVSIPTNRPNMQNAGLPFDPSSAAAGGAGGALTGSEDGEEPDPWRTGLGMVIGGIMGRKGLNAAEREAWAKAIRAAAKRGGKAGDELIQEARVVARQGGLPGFGEEWRQAPFPDAHTGHTPPAQSIDDALPGIINSLHDAPKSVKPVAGQAQPALPTMEPDRNLMTRVSEAVEPFTRRINILRYGSMLSDTAAHAMNAGGGALMSLVDVATTPLMVAQDVVRSAATGKARQAFMAELPARLTGMRVGAGIGLQNAWSILKSGVPLDEAAKLDQAAGGMGVNIPGVAPAGSRRANAANFAFEAPLRALAAADAVFRTMAEGGHLMAEATAAAMKANGGKPVTPEMVREAAKSPELMERVKDLASRTVLQEDRKVTAWYRDMIRNAPEPIRSVVAVEVPFTKTPYNVVAQGLGMTPLGLAGVVQDMAQGRAAREVERRVARVAIGTAVMGAAVSSYAAGNLTGPYPTDAKERSTLPPGWAPWSRKVTDPTSGQTRYLPLSNEGPLAIPSVLAILAVEAHKKGKAALSPEWAGQVALGLGRYAEQQTFFEGLANISKVFDERSGDANIERHVEQIASQFSPHVIGGGALGREIQRVIGMPQRDPAGAIDALLATHPLTADKVAPKQDVIGRPVVHSGGALSAVVRAPVERDVAVVRAYRKAGEGLPLQAPKQVTDPTTNTPRKLTPKQQQAWKRAFGAALNNDWNNMGNPTDQETLQRVESGARTAATETVLGLR